MVLANKKYILVETTERCIIKEMKFRLEKYSFFIPISNGCNKKQNPFIFIVIAFVKKHAFNIKIMMLFLRRLRIFYVFIFFQCFFIFFFS
jgi:hypothetical protein